MTDTSRGKGSTHGSSAGQTSPPRPPLGEAKPVRKSLRFIVNSTYVGNQIVWCTLSTVPKRSRLITRGERRTHGSSAGQTSPPRPPLGEAKSVHPKTCALVAEFGSPWSYAGSLTPESYESISNARQLVSGEWKSARGSSSPRPSCHSNIR